MNWIITTLFWIFFLVILKRTEWLKKDGIPFSWVALAFTIKIIAGILYGYYDSYVLKGGDSLNYFWDSNCLYQSLPSDPIHYLKMITGIGDNDPVIFEKYYACMVSWQTREFDYFLNSGRTVIRLNALIRLFSFGYYNVHVIVFSFLSFIGLTYLFKVFIRTLDLNKKMVFVLLFFVPSLILWGSAVLKEPIILFGVGLFLYHLHKLTNDGFRLQNFISLLFAILILILVRFHVLLCLLPGAIIYYWSVQRGGDLVKKAVTVFALFIIVALSFHWLVPDYNVAHILYGKQMNFIKNEEFQNPGAEVDYIKMKPEFTDIILNTPQAFLKTLIAPVKEIFTNYYRLPFFVENVLFLILLSSSLMLYRTPEKKIHPFLLLCASYILLQYTLIGLTVPFEGAIVRLRSVAIPFLLFIIISFVDSKKMESTKSFLIF